MAEKTCYYEVLRVERTAGKTEIDRAYRKLAIKYHPDSNREDEDAVERFKEATEAYEILSDPEKRQRYDQHGHAGVDGHQFNDVEDISIGPGPEEGVDYLYVSDTGNNDRDRIVMQVYRVREPDMSR